MINDRSTTQPPTTRRRVWQAVHARPAATVADIAVDLDLHPNTVRHHLHQLVQAGAVRAERDAPAGKGRPVARYTATADPDTDPANTATAHVTALVAALLDAARDVDAHTVGASWAQRLPHSPATTIDDLLAHLTEAGYAPTANDDASVVLRDCPLLPVAREHPRLCTVHANILGPQWKLEPFASPAGCVVRPVDSTPDGAHRPDGL